MIHNLYKPSLTEISYKNSSPFWSQLSSGEQSQGCDYNMGARWNYDKADKAARIWVCEICETLHPVFIYMLHKVPTFLVLVLYKRKKKRNNSFLLKH